VVQQIKTSTAQAPSSDLLDRRAAGETAADPRRDPPPALSCAIQACPVTNAALPADRARVAAVADVGTVDG